MQEQKPRREVTRRFGQTHTVTERRVHVEVTWFSVRCAFDFSYATELVIVTQLFVLASARYDQKSLTIKVLVQRSKAFCYAAHIFPSGCFRGARAARCCPQHIEDHNVADDRQVLAFAETGLFHFFEECRIAPSYDRI